MPTAHMQLMHLHIYSIVFNACAPINMCKCMHIQMPTLYVHLFAHEPRLEMAKQLSYVVGKIVQREMPWAIVDGSRSSVG